MNLVNMWFLCMKYLMYMRQKTLKHHQINNKVINSLLIFPPVKGWCPEQNLNSLKFTNVNTDFF